MANPMRGNEWVQWDRKETLAVQGPLPKATTIFTMTTQEWVLERKQRVAIQEEKSSCEQYIHTRNNVEKTTQQIPIFGRAPDKLFAIRLLGQAKQSKANGMVHSSNDIDGLSAYYRSRPTD
jgi:hypothetical protein